MHIHIVHARKQPRRLDASSQLNAEWGFLRHLLGIGRETADRRLADHFDDLGERSSVDLHQMCGGYGALPHA